MLFEIAVSKTGVENGGQYFVIRDVDLTLKSRKEFSGLCYSINYLHVIWSCGIKTLKINFSVENKFFGTNVIKYVNKVNLRGRLNFLRFF